METVVPSFSSTKRALSRILLLSALAGCAASAPPLPADTTSVNRAKAVDLAAFPPDDIALTCERIAVERQDIDRRMGDATGKIEGNRTQNQVTGYFGSLVPPLLLATDGNQAEKAEITQLYGRRDTLVKLGAAKGCRDGV